MIVIKNNVVPRLFDLLPKHEQDEIKRHVLAVMALAEQRKRPVTAYTPDIAPLPPKAKKKISAAQHAAFYSQLNTHKQRTEEPKPGPQAEPKQSRKGERQRKQWWKPGAKSILSKPDKPAKPLSVPQQVRNVLLEHGPLTNRDIALKLGWNGKGESINRVSISTNQMLKRGEIERVGESEDGRIHTYAIVKEWQPKLPQPKKKSSNLLAVAEWLETNGPATVDDVAEFLQCKNTFAESVTARLCQYNMAHRSGYSKVKRNNRPLLLFAAGPEPEKEGN